MGNELSANYVLNCENAFSYMVVAMKLEKRVVSGVQKKSITTAVESTGLLFPYIPFLFHIYSLAFRSSNQL